MAKSCAILPAVCLLVSLAGCNVLSVAPPFEASGTYDGTWEGGLTDVTSTARRCSLILTLTDDSKQLTWLSDFTVGGTCIMNFTCPQVFADFTDAGVPAVLRVPVFGTVTALGRVVLASRETVGGVSIALAIDANGSDEDGDGQMDGLAGTFTLSVDAGQPRLAEIEGTLEAAVDF